MSTDSNIKHKVPIQQFYHLFIRNVFVPESDAADATDAAVDTMQMFWDLF